MYVVVFFVMIFYMSISVVAMDAIMLRGNRSYEGTFEAYKGGRFYFQPREGEKVNVMRSGVTFLSLEPPASVSVKVFGAGKRDDLKFKRYEKGKFVFEEKGREITSARVSIIEMGLDFRHLKSAGTAPEANDFAPSPDIDVEKLIKPGKVTIVHFHLKTDQPGPYTRQENYVSSLPKRSNGRVHVAMINISDWNAPIVKKYNIGSLPQFWFYNRRGKLVKKLAERFTSEDIDEAVKEALRQ